MNEPSPTEKTGGNSAARWQAWLLGALLALITAAVYWPVLKLGFINFDDPDYVSGNPRVQAGLTGESIQWAFTSFYASNWHPLTWLSHMLDCQLYNLNPAGHHLTNLLFHIANSLLLFGLLRRLTGAFWRSALVAALFAWHPLHVESVAWVSERKDVLSSFFFLLTLLAYGKYAEKFQDRNLKTEIRGQSIGAATMSLHPSAGLPGAGFHVRPYIFYLLSLLCFALGLMSKPMLVTLPFVMLLLDYWPLHRWEFKTQNAGLKPLLRLLLEKVPFFALAAASCVVTFLVQQACGAMTSFEKGPLELRLANALVAYARYLGKTFWPTDLAIFYPYVRFSLDSWQVAGAALFLLAATVGLALAHRRRPCLLVGWLWFLGMLVPVIGLVQVGKQSLADRYTYLPHIGLFICVVWGGAAVFGSRRLPRLLACAAAAMVLTACALLTVRQLSFWRDTETLFRRAAAVTARNFVAYTVIGNEFAGQGKLAEAIEQCQRALEISPNYSEAHNTLGNVYAQLKKYDEALFHYRAAAADRTYADPRNGMGNVLIQQGKYAEAEAQCREALQLAPMHLSAMYGLATALHSQGKLDEAADYYRRILALNPDLADPHRNLGKILVAQGKADEAIAALSRALAIQPEDADTRTLLGVTLLGRNRADEAVIQLREATRLQTTNALAHYQLALIHQQRKQAREAAERFRLALKAQPDWPESLNNLAWILAANPDATVRNGTEAVALAERACSLTDYQEPLMIGTLAAAYAEAGRFAEAVSAAEKARGLALAAGQKEIAERNQELLKLYRAGQAYHEKQ